METQIKASKTKDEKVNALLKKLIAVPKSVQYECLWQYVKKCQELHTIAFL